LKLAEMQVQVLRIVSPFSPYAVINGASVIAIVNYDAVMTTGV